MAASQVGCLDGWITLRGRRIHTDVEGFVSVVEVRRIAGCGNQASVRVAPPGAQEQRTFEPRDRQVHRREDVDVITANRAVDEVLGERECRQIGQDRVEVRPDIGQGLQRRFEIRQIVDEIGLGRVDQLGRGVAELPELLQRGHDTGSLLQEDIECRWDRLQGVGDGPSLGRERRRQPVQCPDRRGEPIPLFVNGSHEGVEPGDELANVGFAPGQRGRGAVDEVTDLAQSAGVDDDGQRRQGLLRRRIGRGTIHIDGRAGREPAARHLSGRRVEGHVHRSEQTRLPDRRHCIRRHDDVRPDTHLDVCHPVAGSQFSDAAHHHIVDHHRRIRLQGTDVGDLDVVHRGSRTTCDGTGER